MSDNNTMYRMFRQMIQGYKLGKEGENLFVHAVHCWMDLNPDNPFAEDSAAYDYFFRMKNYYNVWKMRSADQRISERRMINEAKELCATKPKNPYKYDKKAADEIAQTFTTSEEITSSIAPAKIEELRQAYQTGGAASLYDKLGSVSATYQEKFLNYFAEHANSADLCNFASAHSGNKNVILALYQRSNDPALLQYLGEANVFDLMGKGKIKLQDFMRFASPDMVAKYLLTLGIICQKAIVLRMTNMTIQRSWRHC